MKIIISENQFSFIRRMSEVERLIDPLMDDVYTYLQGDDKVTPLPMRLYDVFISTLVMKMANQIANNSSLHGDDKVTLRNRLQRYITNNYGSNIRDYFSNKLEGYKRNINESDDKIKKFLKTKFGIDWTNKIEMVTSSWDIPITFDHIISKVMTDIYLNKFGPMYLIDFGGVNYLFQDRGGELGEVVLGDDESEYYDDEFLTKLGIDMLGLTVSDLINIYFTED